MADILVIVLLKYALCMPINNPLGPDEVGQGLGMAEVPFLAQSICTKLSTDFLDFSILLLRMFTSLSYVCFFSPF